MAYTHTLPIRAKRTIYNRDWVWVESECMWNISTLKIILLPWKFVSPWSFIWNFIDFSICGCVICWSVYIEMMCWWFYGKHFWCLKDSVCLVYYTSGFEVLWKCEHFKFHLNEWKHVEGDNFRSCYGVWLEIPSIEIQHAPSFSHT